MTHREKSFFNIAKQMCRLSNFDRARVGAVVVSGKRVLSASCNSTKTRPLQFYYNEYYIHRQKKRKWNRIENPEINPDTYGQLIFDKGGKNIKWEKVSIFTFRELKTGEKACSKPCPACSRLIKNLGIKNVYYIDEDGDFVKERYI